MSSTEKDEKEHKEKKKRRAIKSEGARNVVSEEKKPKEQNVSSDKTNSRYQFYYEENKVLTRDPEKDLAMHKATCDELKRVMYTIKELKDIGGDEAATKVEEERVHGMLQFVTLKRLNRFSHLRCKKVRDNTNEAKQKIDQYHLQLQNLLYEIMHLQKEITKCLEFKSKDEEIDLVSVDDFYNEAPDNISKPTSTKEDPHQQTLARLDWELEQRKHLDTKRKEAASQRDKLTDEIMTQREYLESLQPKLANILQATKPVQDYLGMPFDEIREQHKTATYLPRPLYVLYMQASAYKDVCDKYMGVTIQGDVEEAKGLDSTAVDLEEDSGESDQEDEEKATEGKKKRRRKTDDKIDHKKHKLLKRHPLSVHMNIHHKDNSTLVLTFNYLMVLEIVTVTVKLTPGHESIVDTIAGGDLTAPETLLDCLYPNDNGTHSPNPSNKFALHKFGIENFSKYVSEVGFPYQWVQQLCGLQFLDDNSKKESTISAGYIETAIKRLRRRVKSRLSLQKQLSSLERKCVPVSKEYIGLYPAKISTSLVSWDRETYQDFIATPYTSNIVAVGVATEEDIYFRAKFQRGTARMVAHVLVPADYPNATPLFAVHINWKHERNNLNDDHVRTLEAEVNIYLGELMDQKFEPMLLTNQVQRLCMCLDVYLESEGCDGVNEGPSEFAREKIFPRVVKGPGRSKPYVFNSTLGFFSQR